MLCLLHPQTCLPSTGVNSEPGGVQQDLYPPRLPCPRGLTTAGKTHGRCARLVKRVRGVAGTPGAAPRVLWEGPLAGASVGCWRGDQWQRALRAQGRPLAFPRTAQGPRVASCPPDRVQPHSGAAPLPCSYGTFPRWPRVASAPRPRGFTEPALPLPGDPVCDLGCPHTLRGWQEVLFLTRVSPFLCS